MESDEEVGLTDLISGEQSSLPNTWECTLYTCTETRTMTTRRVPAVLILGRKLYHSRSLILWRDFTEVVKIISGIS